MNLHIDPVNGLLVAVGCIVGYLVHRRPTRGAALQTPQRPDGDFVGSATAALTTILILAFLFGLGNGEGNHVQDVSPRPAPTAYETPTVEQSQTSLPAP
ncbi:hypothetical protein CUT44_14140 [Streptomyces carminius]|uniref:Uncharacterized protein n=1 Tax=Streptomyces carminius TaxID=2665496 RepID=A0A2M8LYQ9_9ACTN|nr:hypothetical protein [Streptomyces carminius]PJE97118.1 hypothetical protein CUT44_14140 [Streptomyces carminius]